MMYCANSKMASDAVRPTLRSGLNHSSKSSSGTTIARQSSNFLECFDVGSRLIILHIFEAGERAKSSLQDSVLAQKLSASGRSLWVTKKRRKKRRKKHFSLLFFVLPLLRPFLMCRRLFFLFFRT